MPAEAPVALQPRDLELLEKLLSYRYLKTSQAWRLVYVGNPSDGESTVGKRVAQRRLRKLYDAGCLTKVKQKIVYGDGSPEEAYCLDTMGIKVLVALKGFDPEELLGKKPIPPHGSEFLSHLLEVNEFHLSCELALRNHPLVRLQRFVSEFEVRDPKLSGNHKFALFEEFYYEGKTYRLLPDSLVQLQGKGEHERARRLFFVEIDRGTEGIAKIRSKVTAYHALRQSGRFTKWVNVPEFRVLFQTTTAVRVKNILNALSGTPGFNLFLLTEQAKVNASSIFGAPIWMKSDGTTVSLIKNA